MAETYYHVTPDMPPMNVRVKVVWGGRGPFEAARVRHPETRKICWMTERDRRPVFLPVPRARAFDAAAPWAGYHTLDGDNPELWAPIRADLWQLPLPAPALEWADAPARMWTARQEFNATEAAAEMQADRDNVSRETSVREDTAARVAWQWWRDASLIRYEPSESLTIRMAEGRVMRAVACCAPGSGLTLKRHSYSTIMAAVAEAVAASDEPVTSDIGTRFEPLPQDHTDFLTAMGWFTALGLPPLPQPGAHVGRRRKAWDFTRAQKVLIWRSLSIPWSFDEIGLELELSGERCRQIEKTALATVWNIGRAAASPLDAPIQELRERNRRVRRAAVVL